jgi:hypothetical protein
MIMRILCLAGISVRDQGSFLLNWLDHIGAAVDYLDLGQSPTISGNHLNSFWTRRQDDRYCHKPTAMIT